MLKKVKAWFKNLWEYTKATFSNPEFWTEYRDTVLYFMRMEEYSCMGNFNYETRKAKYKNDQEKFDKWLRYLDLKHWYRKTSVTNFRVAVTILKNVLIGLLVIGVIISSFVWLWKVTEKTDAEMLKEEQDHVREYIRPIEIDGCEYLFYYNSPHFSITHKGNCKNPIHKKE